ncbi:hypothetical protein BT69DRAFT_367098 [Atractiella rhizophila]|nr:hypothetical protein BT69DRAFT_367098 [Atractiella rhizophila]
MLLPLYPPPSSPLPPPLPLRTSSTIASVGWCTSTHIFPAAYPRTRLGAVTNPSERGKKLFTWKDASGAREQMESLKRHLRSTTERTVDSFAVESAKEEGLWIAVNRYAPLHVMEAEANQGITIILCHANGLHKETWEPFIYHLVQGHPNLRISEIWALDVVQQGDSAILNEGKIGDVHDSLDYGRDVLHFILRYLPHQPSAPSSHPYVLDPTRLDVIDLSPPIRQPGRCIVGAGQSIGGAAHSIAISCIPHLYTHLSLFDPSISPRSRPNSAGSERYNDLLIYGTLKQKDRWKSLEDARKEVEGRGIWKGWDGEVMKLFWETNLVHDGDGVRVKTHREAQAIGVANVHSRVWQIFDMLSTAPGQKIHLHFPLPSPSVVHSEADVAAFLERLEGATVWRCADGVGHLSIQMDPYGMAHNFAAALSEGKRVGKKTKL